MTQPIIQSREVCPTCGHRQSDFDFAFRQGWEAATKVQLALCLKGGRELVSPPAQGEY